MELHRLIHEQALAKYEAALAEEKFTVESFVQKRLDHYKANNWTKYK